MADLHEEARSVVGSVFSDGGSGDDGHATSLEEENDRGDDVAEDAFVGNKGASTDDKAFHWNQGAPAPDREQQKAPMNDTGVMQIRQVADHAIAPPIPAPAQDTEPNLAAR